MGVVLVASFVVKAEVQDSIRGFSNSNAQDRESGDCLIIKRAWIESFRILTVGSFSRS